MGRSRSLIVVGGVAADAAARGIREIDAEGRNTWDQVDAARALIAEAGSLRPADLRGRLPSP